MNDGPLPLSLSYEKKAAGENNFYMTALAFHFLKLLRKNIPLPVAGNLH